MADTEISEEFEAVLLNASSDIAEWSDEEVKEHYDLMVSKLEHIGIPGPLTKRDLAIITVAVTEVASEVYEILKEAPEFRTTFFLIDNTPFAYLHLLRQNNE